MRIGIKGDEVYLENVSMADAESISKNANDLEVSKNLGGTGHFPFPYAVSDALDFIRKAMDLYVNMQELHFAIKLNGHAIGMAGIFNIDYKNQKCEIGYWIGRTYWRKGYGKKAVILLMHTAFESLQMNKICAKVFAFNSGSVTFLLKLGFKIEGRMAEDYFFEEYGRFEDVILLSMLKKEYKEGTANVTIEQ